MPETVDVTVSKLEMGLDPSRHSTILFKIALDAATGETLERDSSGSWAKGKTVKKGMGVNVANSRLSKKILNPLFLKALILRLGMVQKLI